jgi:FAD/FMN-containing dehydrogenase
VALPEAVDLIVAERASPHAEWHALAGWGESVWALANVAGPRSADEVAAFLARASEEGRRVTLRGAGRSYGDAALPTDRLVLDLGRMRRIGDVDEETGRVIVEPGVTVEQLWRTALPRGFWPPVVSGTMRPTIGGCVAMNVHGKNQFCAGSFGDHVEELELVTARGERRAVHRERDADLFHAVIGSAGMLGVVTSVTLRLQRVHSGLLDVAARAHGSLGETASDLDARRDGADYLVGWIDAFDRDGRGVIHAARHLREGEDPEADRTRTLEAQELPARLLGVVPRDKVALLMRPFARPFGMRAINAAKYRSAALRGEHRFRQPHAAFHFLLDYVPGWKSIYDPGGLIQHQSFVPAEAAVETHRRLLTMCRDVGIVSWLAVLKRHRPDGFLMSHSVDGFSLALDFPVTSANRQALWSLCGELDRVVLDAGGRFYLAKDLTASPESFRRSYPGLDRFLEWKRELDPGGVLTSALADRLEMLA